MGSGGAKRGLNGTSKSRLDYQFISKSRLDYQFIKPNFAKNNNLKKIMRGNFTPFISIFLNSETTFFHYHSQRFPDDRHTDGQINL